MFFYMKRKEMGKYDETMRQLDEQVGNKDGLIYPIQDCARIRSRWEEPSCIVIADDEGGALYVVTSTTSGKMRQIA